MREMEDGGYLRMSEPAATYAFHTDPSGVSLVNLRWLIEVIQHYEASGITLADLPTERERLDFVRALTDHVDDDVLVACLKKPRV